MARISPDEVREIALLARLHLGEQEIAKMAAELDGILGHIEQIQALDVGDAEPLTHAVSIDCPLRPDEVAPSLAIEDVLGNAPRREDRFFQVPRIVPVAGKDGKAGQVGKVGKVGSDGKAGQVGKVGKVGSDGKAGQVGKVGSNGSGS